MNTRSKTTWALALAAVTLSLTSACGSEVAPPAQDIGNVNRPQAPGVEQGTARLQNDDSGGTAGPSERNLARKDFTDNGGA